MAKIDIFGDKKHVFDSENLPKEFTNENGKYVLSRGTVGFSYLLTEPSASFVEFINEMNKKDVEREQKLKNDLSTLSDLVLRVEALEKNK